MGGMRCDGCGQDVRGQDTVEDTRRESLGKWGSIGPIRIILCQGCARRRSNTIWYFVGFFLLPVIVCVLLGILALMAR
jgi:hypothetical protein